MRFSVVRRRLMLVALTFSVTLATVGDLAVDLGCGRSCGGTIDVVRDLVRGRAAADRAVRGGPARRRLSGGLAGCAARPRRPRLHHDARKRDDDVDRRRWRPNVPDGRVVRGAVPCGRGGREPEPETVEPAGDVPHSRRLGGNDAGGGECAARPVSFRRARCHGSSRGCGSTRRQGGTRWGTCSRRTSRAPGACPGRRRRIGW